MKTKFIKLILAFIVLAPCAKAQDNFRNFDGNEYIKIEDKWQVLDPVTLSYYTINEKALTVKFKNSTDENTIAEIAKKYGLKLIRKSVTNWFDFDLASESDLFEIALSLRSFECIDFVEISTFGNYDSVSNDPLHNLQWALDKIDAYEAWDLTTGSPNVTVAILDSGTDWTHDDLGSGTDGYQNIYLNSGEDAWSNPNVPSSGNGIDDDNNGYIDDWKGWDFELSNNDSRSGNNHGTIVSGIVGGKTNNSLGISGIAGGWNGEGCKLMTIGVGDAYPDATILDNAIIYASEMGADIIQLSLHIFSSNYQSISDAIDYAYNVHGVTIVCSAGNYGVETVLFPASHPNVISVASTDSQDNLSTSSCFGNHLFMSAPGVGIRSTSTNNLYTMNGGTSFAAPMVSATIALMKSINPCLTQEDIRFILRETADKVGDYDYDFDPANPGLSLELGYGRLNANVAVVYAYGYLNAQVDLYMQDTPEDVGAEPNMESQYFWGSQDIWVRNSADQLHIHENPEYDPNQPNYVYVRVRNRGCVPSNGNDKLSVYWTKGGAGLAWDYDWTGNYFPANGPLHGDEVGTLTIPALQPDEEIIIEFEWYVPNPQDYFGINGEPWHYCLMARLVSEDDPMALPETINMPANTQNNNNIIWKNITVVDLLTVDDQPKSFAGTISLSNPFEENHLFNLEFVIDDSDLEEPIFEAAEVTVKLDGVVLEKWVDGGMIGDLVSETRDKNTIEIEGNKASLQNLKFGPHEYATITLEFHFLAEKISAKSDYTLHVIQRDKETSQIIGGETYLVRKSKRPGMTSYSSISLKADVGELVAFTAQKLEEEAIYNWYNSEDELVASGVEFQTNAKENCTYTLEVTAVSNGYRFYEEAKLEINPARITNVSPNPASGAVTIDYILNLNTSLQVKIIGTYANSNIEKIHSVPENSDNLIIDLNGLQHGFYTVALISANQIFDATILLVE
jgi:serine protease